MSPKSKTRKITLTNWLTIASLLITAFIGIFIALYINKRDEDLQKQLILLQGQNQYSNLEVGTYDYYPSISESVGGTLPEIIITNKGPATANEISIAVCIANINLIWQSSIMNINQFDISVSPQSYKVLTELKSTCLDSDLKNNNLLVLNIDSLPPNQSITVMINIGHTLEYTTVDTTRKASIKIPAAEVPKFSTPPFSLYFYNKLMYTLDEKFYVSKFVVDISCPNCSKIDAVDKEHHFATQSFYLTFHGLISGTITNEEVVADNDNYIEENFDLGLQYVIPKDFVDSESNMPMYLVPNPSNLYLFSEVSIDEYNKHEIKP
jgi:hypothetical protein